MCIIFLAIGCLPKYKLVLLSNRDEYLDRPTALAHIWEDGNILAGRDLQRFGTWLGITKTGRFASVTNYRVAFAEQQPNKKSRGDLVTYFLRSHLPAFEWAEQELAPHAEDYDGFNIILRDEHGQMCHYSNKTKELTRLVPGKVYAVSNHLLDTEWPKLCHGKQQLQCVIETLMEKEAKVVAEEEQQQLEKEKEKEKESRKTREEGEKGDSGGGSGGALSTPSLDKELHESLFKILTDRTTFPDSQLPNTGVGLEWERLLGSIFVDGETYGTRASTLILIDQNDNLTFVERSRKPNEDGSTSPTAPFVENVFTFPLERKLKE